MSLGCCRLWGSIRHDCFGQSKRTKHKILLIGILIMAYKSVSSGSLRGSSILSPMALGSNVSEDTDDMFDDLFKKYGKVVYTRNDQKSPIAEVDDDAESLSCNHDSSLVYVNGKAAARLH